MRYFLFTLIAIIVLKSSALEAQTDVSVRRQDFKTDKPGFQTAWDHVTKGDSYYKQKGIWYGFAFDEYLEAIIYNSSNPELNYKAGVSALYSDKKEEAAGFLLKAFELKNDISADMLFLIGRALQYAGRFTEGIEKFNDYLNSTGKKSKENIALAKKGIEECNSALKIVQDTLRISITNAGANINSISDDYAELLTADGNTLFFASRRELPGSNNHYKDSKFDENIFVSQRTNDLWGPAASAGNKINTKYCEAPLYINPANDLLYIYSGYEKGGDIKMSKFKKGQWQTPQAVPYKINTKGSETAFTFSPSGNEIYYVTDKGKNSFGGKDIYFIKRLGERRWSKPQNAGPMINTPWDEESVRFSKTGDTLWFSSRGHNSIGGFDIFYSVRDQNGVWDSVKNCGYPVNTPWDDMFFYPSPANDSIFYFVSNRGGGTGGLDIYQGRVMPPEPEPVAFVEEVLPVVPAPAEPVMQPEPVKQLVLNLTGKVKDSENGDPVIAKIDVIDSVTKLVVATTASSDVDGSYKVGLPEKKSYTIDVKATGFLPEMKQIVIPESYSQEIYNLDVELIKVKVGKRVVLNNILFETGKSILTPGSYSELDRLYNILQDNPLMKIEISGHTDITGSAALNLRLSADRAKAVVEYMVQKGVDRSRMESKGFGSQQPISDNTTSAGRAKNRRVEFKILEF
jgi:outer membrane protein OmpA-like peptidoglycan-associated protein